MAVLECVEHQIDGIVQGHHEAGHVGIGDRNGLAVGHLLNPQRDDRASAGHDIAVTRAADRRCRTFAQLAPFGYGDFLHQRLADAHRVDWVGRFVRGEHDDISDAMFDGRVQYVSCAQDIRTCSFHRKELARRNLFQRCCRENIIYASHGDVDR